MSLDELRKEIAFGLENLEKVYQNIVSFSESQVALEIKTSALTFECFGYYNALEHLMIRILKHLGREIPSGAFSHRDTLKMFQVLVRSHGLGDDETITALEVLMAFRHVATKIYGFLIDWDKLQAVVAEIQKLHPSFVKLFDAVVASLQQEK